MSAAAVRIDVWSDYVCPFCYLAEPTLKCVEQKFGRVVEVVWRAFELRPEPVPTLDPSGDYLRDVWARAVYPMARERGMTLRLPPVQPRSRFAHEAVAFARTQGKSVELNEALFRAFFEHGQDIGKVDALVTCGAQIGLGAEELRRALQEGRHRSEVLDDEQRAHELQITGVPAMVVRRVSPSSYEPAAVIEGAQPFERVCRVVERQLAQGRA